MTQGSVKIKKKFGIPLIIAAGLIFLIGVFFLYRASGEETTAFYRQDDSAVTLESVSPDGVGGVSRDSLIVLKWSGPVSADVADAVTIRPSVRGKWKVNGADLIFTPQKMKGGTYYTVTIPKGTALNEKGDTLKTDVFFSFETASSSLRIPDTEAFSVDGRGFTFGETDTVAIPVSYVGEEDGSVDVEVFRAEDSEAFLRCFDGLFAYPTWAKRSVADFSAEEKDFDEVMKTELAVRSEGTASYVDIGSLPVGQYLVRLSALDASYDIAVTVSSLDMNLICDGKTLALWGHKNGRSVRDLTFRVNGRSCFGDENGFVSLPWKISPAAVDRDPSVLAVVLSDGSEEIVSFIRYEDAVSAGDGELVLNRTVYHKDDDISVFGTVFTSLGSPCEGKVRLEICSSSGVIAEKQVKVENGTFSHTFERMTLPDGDYTLRARFNGNILSATSFSFGEETPELFLSAGQMSDDDENTAFRAFLRDRNGDPVPGGKVTLNGTVSLNCDGEGVALFRNAEVIDDDSVDGKARFHAASLWGEAADYTLTIPGEKGNTLNRPESEKTLSGGKVLSLSQGKNRFVSLSGEEAPVLKLRYKNGDCAVEEADPVSAVDVNVEYDGGSVSFDAAITGKGTVTVVSLCDGTLPASFSDGIFREESLTDAYYGTTVASYVFFGTEAVSGSFGLENIKGDAFIRVAVKQPLGGVVAAYGAVPVKGVILFGADRFSFAESDSVVLPFCTDSRSSCTYELTLNDTVSEGDCEGDFTVDIGKLPCGIYHGEIRLLRDGASIAAKSFTVEVYRRLPMFTTVKKGNDPDAYLRLDVSAKDASAVAACLELVALPGDQILERMAKSLFFDSVDEELFSDPSRVDFDLSLYQNNDGGFGRYENAESDLLLSALVADEESFLCDRDSLLTYLKYRLTTAESPEQAAAACWGLSCFGLDCAESMAKLASSAGSEDRVLLYLAEGYYAAGDKVSARKLYEKLADSLKGDESGLHFGNGTDPFDVANTAFLLDLSVKLNEPEQEDVMAFLTDSVPQSQTGRYLLLSSLVRMIDDRAVSPANGKKAEEGREILSLVSGTDQDVPALETVFTCNGETVTSGEKGQITEMTVRWEAPENDIFLVYVDTSAGITVAAKDGLTAKKGYYEFVTAEPAATVTFVSDKAGNAALPAVYIINLTKGTIVGRADGGKWKVES